MCVQIHTHMTHTHMFTCPHTYTFFFLFLDFILSGRGKLEQGKALMAEDAASERQHI